MVSQILKRKTLCALKVWFYMCRTQYILGLDISVYIYIPVPVI